MINEQKANEMIESLVNVLHAEVCGVPEEVEGEEEYEASSPEDQARHERWLHGIKGHPDDQVDLWKVFGLERPEEK